MEHSLIESSSFYECSFQGCSFFESIFKNCRFVDCTFEECDLSLVQVPASVFLRTRFDSSKLIGIDWTRATWEKAGLSAPLSFYKCSLSHCTFIGLKLNKVQVVDCTAADVDFRETDLSGAIFRGTDLAKSLFGNTNLSESDLSGARNYTIAADKNTLKKAKFSLPEALSLLFDLDILLVEESDER